MRIQHLFHEMSLGSLTGRDAPEEAPPKEVANYAPLLLWSIWILTVVSAIFLALRVYAKLMRRRSLWWDDYFLILSWVRDSPLFNIPRFRSGFTVNPGLLLTPACRPKGFRSGFTANTGLFANNCCP